MISKKVWSAVNKVKLTKTQLSGLIRCHMFLKETFNAQGEFEKVTARLTAGGDLQDKNLQSSLLWYKKLTSVLIAHGFVAIEYDPCVLNKTVSGHQITVCVHVDDLLVASANDCALEDFQKMLETNSENITARSGNQHSYLAMNIENTSDGITVDMRAYIDKPLDGRHITRAKSPANADMFDVPDTSPKLSDAKRKTFHSDVARLVYLAKRTLVDILTAISHLSSRVIDPDRG